MCLKNPSDGGGGSGGGNREEWKKSYFTFHIFHFHKSGALLLEFIVKLK
jgi:hypothetical protein